jgi:hypothetical protein
MNLTIITIIEVVDTEFWSRGSFSLLLVYLHVIPVNVNNGQQISKRCKSGFIF